MGYCTVREDLIGLAVPVGEEFTTSPGPYEYRWVSNVFQIKNNEEWVEAYSIDFELK